MRAARTTGAAIFSALLLAAASACASSGQAGSAGGGSVTIGESTTLTGAIADLGQTGQQGVALGVDDLNAKGGVLGKQVKLVSADDGATPATGAANVRSMILDDHAVALFGPVSSAVAAAEEQVAGQQRVPIFFHTSNDIGLLTTHYTKYAFQTVPNTIMEPRAVAAYMASQITPGQQITIGTFAPDYSFGHDTVAGFIKALDDLHVNYKLVKQEFPPLAATDISPYLSALESAAPQYVFNAQFGTQLTAFTQQAAAANFFAHTKVIAMYAYSSLKALGSDAPAGAIGFDRAPFWVYGTTQMTSFVQEFHRKYGTYPSEWSILGYASVQEWAYGVEKAKSFGADAVAAAIPGATIPSVLGALTIRACDHQAELPEYVGVVAAQADPTYGARLWQPGAYTAPFDKIALTCDKVQALR